MVHEFLDFADIYVRGDYEQMKAGLKTSELVIRTAEQAGRSAGIPFGK
jgi:hypothetical protein